MRNTHKILVGKPDGRPRCRLEIILKYIFKKRNIRVWTGFSWLMFRDPWLALVNTVINFRDPQKTVDL